MEIDEELDAKITKPQVCLELSLVRVDDCLDCLAFHDHRSIDEDVAR